MARYRIEYYNTKEEYNSVYYIIASTAENAVDIFRKSFSKDRYNIVEVSMCIDKDWSKY